MSGAPALASWVRGINGALKLRCKSRTARNTPSDQERKEPLESFGLRLPQSYIDRITRDAEELGLKPREYARVLIRDALTKDPGQDLDNLRLTVTELQDQLADTSAMLRKMFEVLLLTLAKDSGGHNTAQVETLLQTVFGKK